MNKEPIDTPLQKLHEFFCNNFKEELDNNDELSFKLDKIWEILSTEEDNLYKDFFVAGVAQQACGYKYDLHKSFDEEVTRKFNR